MTPSVSVLVTVYNRERYLAECLESILASTWKDFEVIVVDDLSSDGSVAIAERFASSDARIRFYRNATNLGDYPNRMRAAELARGKYIKYLDSDDVIYPHSLGLMIGAMETNPDAALGLSHSAPEEAEPYPWKLAPVHSWRKQFLGDGCMGCGPSGAIIRRHEFLQLGGFGNWGVLSDTDMWYRMSAKWPIVLLPPALVWWRRHGDQEFTRNGAADAYLEQRHLLDVSALSSRECPLGTDDSARALRRARQHHSRRLLSLAVHGRPLDGVALFRRSGLGLRDLVRGLRAYS